MKFPLDSYTLTQGYSNAHTGLDLAAPKGTPIQAAVTGTVILTGGDENYIGGRYVIIREDHPDHYEYYTGHMDVIYVYQGQHVNEGTDIGTVGTTGQATGPHVHFQIRKFNFGDLMNPNTVYNERNAAPTVNQPLGGNDMTVTPDKVREIYAKYTDHEPTDSDVKFYTDNGFSEAGVLGNLVNNGDLKIVHDLVSTNMDTVNDLRGQVDNLRSQLASATVLQTPPILNKNTPSGRGFRTFYQAALAALPVVIGALALPEVQTFFTDPVTTASVLALGAGVISYIQNKTKS